MEGAVYGAVDGAMAYLVCTAPCLEDQWSPHIPGPEELGQAGLLGSKGQPTMAQAGLTLFHSQTSPGTEKLGWWAPGMPLARPRLENDVGNLAFSTARLGLPRVSTS